MNNITINLENNDKPLYDQIYNFIKNEIQMGKLKSHTKLPSKRSLANHLAVSLNTIDSAYQQLVSEGYVISIPKKGFYVCEISGHFAMNKKIMVNENNKIENPNIKIDFSPSGIDIREFPFSLWRKIFKNSFNDVEYLKSFPPQGDMDLRNVIAQYLHESRGVNCSSEQIIIGAGTDYLMQILSLLLDKSGVIVTENPLYNKAYKIFEGMGHRVETISIDEKGILVEPLYKMNPSAIYITPSHQFPLGINMPISRRTQLLSWANTIENCYIIEDDYDSEFRYKGRPIPSLQSIDSKNKVIYIGTFSRSIAPFVRVSYMILPEPLLKNYTNNYSFLSCTVSPLEQKTLTLFIKNGYFERHLNKMRNIYKSRREEFVQNLSIFGSNLEILGESAGHHLLLKLKTNLNESEMCEKAISHGARVYGISNYFVGDTPKKYKSIVLAGYGGLNCDEISSGINLLFDAWMK